MTSFVREHLALVAVTGYAVIFGVWLVGLWRILRR